MGCIHPQLYYIHPQLYYIHPELYYIHPELYYIHPWTLRNADDDLYLAKLASFESS